MQSLVFVIQHIHARCEAAAQNVNIGLVDAGHVQRVYAAIFQQVHAQGHCTPVHLSSFCNASLQCTAVHSSCVAWCCSRFCLHEDAELACSNLTACLMEYVYFLQVTDAWVWNLG